MRRATALLFAATALSAPASAGAHGDPASDVLLFQDAYTPFFPAPAKSETQRLSRLLSEARRAGYPMKVALIQGDGDLGSSPELFGRPAAYARMLEDELAIRVKKPHLLVVMAQGGMAGRNLGPDAAEILDGIEIDTAAESDGLVRAALQAVAGVAAANGHPISVPGTEDETQPRAADDGRSHTALYLVSAIIVALGMALIAFSLVVRRRGTPA